MLRIFKLPPSVPYASNCYLIESCGEYALIDPSADLRKSVEQYPGILEGLKYILITHSHFDHILTVNDWTSICKDVYIGKDDAAGLSDAKLNCYLGFLGVEDGYFGEYKALSEGDTLKLGDETIKVIDCPGHTLGGVSYHVGDNVFCGDTVFAKGGYGRCDLPGGDINTLEKTLIKLITHINDAVFYPGHGESTSLKDLIYYFM